MKRISLLLFATLAVVGLGSLQVHGQSPTETGAAQTAPASASPVAPISENLPIRLDCGNSNCWQGSEPRCERLWFTSDYILWWVKNGSAPPLATTGSLSNPKLGAIGQPGAVVVLGNSALDYGALSGVKLSAGLWFDPERIFGIEAGGFILATRSVNQSVASNANGSPALFRPLNNATTGEDTFFMAAPGFVAGNMTLSSTCSFTGTEVNFAWSPWANSRWQPVFLLGWRHLYLEEQINLTTFNRDFGNFFGTGFLASPSNPGNFEPIGSTLLVTDSFRTRNQFDGGQLTLGLRRDLPGALQLDVRAGIALGNNHQIIDVNGTTTQTQPGLPPASFASGVLAAPSNIGQFQRNQFSVVPEGNVRLSYGLGAMRVFLGYDFTYWTDVIRPGDQISRNVDFRSIPSSFMYTPGLTTALPARPTFQKTDFWAQGLSFGLEFRF